MKRYIYVLMFGVVSLLPFASLIKAEAQELTYENEVLGVKIVGPAGWYMYTQENPGKYVEKPDSFKENIAKEGVLIIFSNISRFYDVAGGANTLLCLESKKFTSSDPLDKRTPMEVAKKYIGEKTKLDEGPKSIVLSGKEGVIFTYTMPRSGPLPSIKETVCIFVKGDAAYIVSFFCDASVYNDLIKDVQISINSLAFK